MNTTTSFPRPDEVEAATPHDRDRALDVIRIVALLGVVVGHTVMATSTVRDDVFIWSNLLTTSPVLQALTWVFQIMPLFFFAGVAASVTSWTPAGSWGGWLMRRCTRLYRPVFYYLAFWAVTLTVLRLVLPVDVYRPIAGISTQLLWFLGAYVLVLAAMPALARLTTVGRFAAAVALIYGAVAAVDILRIHTEAPAVLGYLNLVTWLIPGMFGVAYRRKLLRPAAAVGVAVTALAVNVALVAFGPYELSLVGVDGQQLKNMSPPSLLLAGHAIMMCAAAIAAAPAIARWAARPRVWWLTVIGNSGAMTLYLWHMPPLLAMHLAFAYLGRSRFDPAAADFVALSVVQVVLMTVMVGAAFVVLRPLENDPLPLWDGGTVTARGAQSIAVGSLLCVAAAATLASVGWGLKDAGLYCTAAMVAALVAARMTAGEGSISRSCGGIHDGSRADRARGTAARDLPSAPRR